jgi:hypothetical protein
MMTCYSAMLAVSLDANGGAGQPHPWTVGRGRAS